MRLRRLITVAAATLLASVTAITTAHAEVGTATFTGPPYLPTTCYGNDAGQFPSSNLFVFVDEGNWDNGAACGRQYLLKCISASVPRVCHNDVTIQVRVLGRRDGATMTLSEEASNAVADIAKVKQINIEFSKI